MFKFFSPSFWLVRNLSSLAERFPTSGNDKLSTAIIGTEFAMNKVVVSMNL